MCNWMFEKRDSMPRDLTCLSLLTQSISKKTKERRKHRKDEKKDDWMNDTKVRPNFAIAFLGASCLFSGWVLTTLGTLKCPPGPMCVSVCFSLCADCQVLKVKPCLQAKVPIRSRIIPGSVPGVFKQVCHTDGWQLSRDSVPQLCISFYLWYKFFKVVCQPPNLVREETGGIVPTLPHMEKT